MARRALGALGDWLILLSGPLIWSAHLGFVYAAATVEITLTGQAGLASRLLIGLVTLGCLGGIAAMGVALWRGRLPQWERPRPGLAGLWRRAGMLLCLIAFMGVLWQGLAAMIVPGDPASHAALDGGTAPSESPPR